MPTAVVVRQASAYRRVAPERDSPQGGSLLVTLVVCVLLSGFINLAHVGDFYVATLIIDVTVLWMLAVTLGHFARHRGAVETPPWVPAYVLLLAVYAALLTHGDESVSDKLIVVRSQVLYASVALFASAVASRASLLRALRLMERLGLGLAIFGIAQFVLRAQLPEWLLVSRDTSLFGYYGTEITRSTALLGNTIVYSNVMLIFGALAWARIARGASTPGAVLRALIFMGAVVVSFSRTAIIGIVFVALVCTFLALMRAGANGLVRIVVGFLVALVAWLGVGQVRDIQASAEDTFLIGGLFLAQNASVRGSTAGHAEFFETAMESFHESPVVGLGLASQVQGSSLSDERRVITDGVWLSLLAEGGIVLVSGQAGFLLVVLGSIALRARRLAEHRYLATALVMYLGFQLAVAFWLNSAFFGKAGFLVFWLLFGVVMGLSRGHPGSGIDSSSLATSGPAWGSTDPWATPRSTLDTSASPLLGGKLE